MLFVLFLLVAYVIPVLFIRDVENYARLPLEQAIPEGDAQSALARA